MIEDNQKEEWRIYNTSKEFSKDLKFNRKWYHLIAIFDQDQGENFDFNNDIDPGEEFDFNQVIEPTIYSSEDFVNTDEIEFDFNSPLMEKYKITEIGLIMNNLNEGAIIDQKAKSYDISKITDNKDFIKFYEAINKFQFKGFYIKTALEVFNSDNDDIIATINDTTNFKHADISKSILSTLLKAGGGHANEATIQLLSDIDDKNKPADYNKQNIIQLLSNISICNTANLMEFPDAVFINNDAIPVDLKVAYNNRMSGASGRNLRYMSGIYNALLNAIESKQLLIDYIKNTVISVKYNGDSVIGVETTILPELKGFLLISSTLYDREKGNLNYSGICMRPIIACMHGRNRVANDPLFASKGGLGQGAISYDNGVDKVFDEKESILNGCPERFALVIKNFYKNLIENSNTQYGDLRMFLDSKITSSDTFENNLNIIYKAIDPTWEFNFNKENLTEK